MGMDTSAGTRQTSSRHLFIFDIGGVLIGLDRSSREALLGATASFAPDATARLSELNAQFRLGQINENVYVENACDIYAVSAETLYQAEDAFLVAGDPRMMKLIEDLSKSHRTIAFSNTHAIHWRRVERDLIAAEAFHSFYLSHEIGLEKPDLASFEAVAERESYSPENIIFVDDTLMNIEAARSTGWGYCIHHRSSTETIAQIERILTE